MKRLFWMLAGLTLSGGGALPAQTYVPEPKPNQLVITSEGPSTLDAIQQRAIWQDRVLVTEPGMKLSCNWLVANKMPHENDPSRQVVATNNVLIDFIDDKGQTNHASCDRAVYDFQLVGQATNETLTLTGHAKITNPQYTVTGEPLVWDLLTRKFTATHPEFVFNHSALSLMGTNSPKSRTNSPGFTPPPPARTNNLSSNLALPATTNQAASRPAPPPRTNSPLFNRTTSSGLNAKGIRYATKPATTNLPPQP